MKSIIKTFFLKKDYQIKFAYYLAIIFILNFIFRA